MNTSPRATTSLRARRNTLADPSVQLAALEALDIPDFHPSLVAGEPGIFQINVGRLCNMTCSHCHVDAGPDRIAENMSPETLAACLLALEGLPTVHTVDITGGAPELHPGFRDLVTHCAERGLNVIDRCNLTVLLLPKLAGLPAFLARHRVEIVCSLPHFQEDNTDAQRGDGTFVQSIRALRLLNQAGYGQGDPDRRLTLMSNPVGTSLSTQNPSLEAQWKAALEGDHGVQFDRLIAMNNMPIARFLEWLQGRGNLACYMALLVKSFQPATLDGLMCRDTLSIGWDGRLFDCDFNQMLDMDLELPDRSRPTIHTLLAGSLAGRGIRTHRHCFGCTAGSGSSCGGATA
jgi:radical SAM/Cys-rich protein